MKRRRSNSSSSSSSSSSSVSICSSSSSSTVVDQGIRNDSVVDHHPTISTARATANNPKPMKNNKRGRDGNRRSCSSHEGADGSRPPTNSSKKRCSINVGASDSGSLQNAAAPVTPSTENNGGRGKSGSRGSGRSSVFRGVTRHRWTGRFEAHLWDKSWNSSRNKKGRQVYLGAYDNEEDAARTYDLAALKYWGPDTTLNFSLENYGREVEEMRDASREEYLASLRRRSSGFSRGVSKYRGVARHHHNGRWEARIGRVFGNKYLYLGTFSSQEEAAVAYDLAAIQHRGANAVTNFDISNYTASLKDIISSPHQLHRQNPNDVESKPPRHQRSREPPPRREQQQQQPPRCRNQLPAATADQTDSHRSPLSFGSSSAFSGIGVPKQEPCCFRNEGQDHPWTNFCLDVGHTIIDCGDPFLVPDVLVPLDMEEDDGHLLDLIGEMEFEENIDLIFQGDSVLDVDLGGILQRDNVNADSGVANVPNDVEDSNNIDKLKFSSFSPSSSTINSMLCQF